VAVLNILFFVFHTLLIGFNVAGWAWRATRRWNLLTLALTAVSWFAMGLWHGVGYCVCTDWHMQVRRAMGIRDPESSYVQLLFRCILGLHVPTWAVDTLCGVAFAASLVISLSLNIRDSRRARAV
jgi:hypothetical protein